MSHRNSLALFTALTLVFIAILSIQLLAQQPSPSGTPAQVPPPASSPSSDSAAQKLPPATAPAPGSSEAAWTLLTTAKASEKTRDRSDVLSALTVLDANRKAVSMIADALKDKEESIRVLAATSLGDMKARSAVPALKESLDDPSAQVAFASAQALWKMGDHSGRDVFYEILDGERKTSPNLLKRKMHQAKQDMHDPKALVLIGINEASGALLGPFSMSVSMIEESAKNSSAPVQALCAQLLATDHDSHTIDELRDALSDKNWTIRAAAARALAKLNAVIALPDLKDMMENDKSQPARFAAAAAIVKFSGHAVQKSSPRASSSSNRPSSVLPEANKPS